MKAEVMNRFPRLREHSPRIMRVFRRRRILLHLQVGRRLYVRRPERRQPSQLICAIDFRGTSIHGGVSDPVEPELLVVHIRNVA